MGLVVKFSGNRELEGLLQDLYGWCYGMLEH